jgi:hypothetical protein
MSKKETRRAARQAFPKAKGAPTGKGMAGGRGATRSGAYTKRTTGTRSRAAALPRGVKPPSVKRSAIHAVIWAVIYFVFITWIWKAAGTTMASNAIISFAFMFLFMGVFYFVDWFKYRRYQRKQKDSTK